MMMTLSIKGVVPGEEEHIYVDDETFCPHDTSPLDLEYKVKAIQYWRSGKKRKRPFESVQRKFKQLKSRNDLYRWEEDVQKNRTKFDKLTLSQRLLIINF